MPAGASRYRIWRGRIPFMVCESMRPGGEPSAASIVGIGSDSLSSSAGQNAVFLSVDAMAAPSERASSFVAAACIGGPAHVPTGIVSEDRVKGSLLLIVFLYRVVTQSQQCPREVQAFLGSHMIGTDSTSDLG